MSERSRIEAELVELLAGLPLMHEPMSRHQFVQNVRQRLDHRVVLHNVEEPRLQSTAIVTACAPVPTALREVIGVVALYSPEAAQLHELCRLAYEREVVDVLLEVDWSELRGLLTATHPPNPGRLYQQATDHQLSSPPEWCGSAWDMFVHLSGQNALPDSLPPGMIFLLLLEQVVDSPTAAVIRRRNQRRATDLEVTALLDQRRAVVNTGANLPLEPSVYLVIQVEPEQEPDVALDVRPDPPEQYAVSHYRQWYGDGSWHSRPHGRIPDVSFDQLPAVVEQIIRQTEEEWSDRRSETVVEFVLPVRLLNEDVAWWRKEPAGDYLDEKVLAMDYPVVVRSLERLREKGWHHVWRRRWEQLQSDPVRGRLYRSRPGWTDFTQLEAALNSDLRWAALLLSEPPVEDGSDARTGIREVMTALRAGVPVVIWHRTRPTSDAFWEEVHEMTADGNIAGLPKRVRESRLDALQVAQERLPGHPGRHLAVLWDDPERMPELTDALPTTEMAG